MSEPISNDADIIDSRDVIDRLAYLDALDHKDLDDDEVRELAALEALAVQGQDYAVDWEHGEALIRDSYFVDYAKELAEDVGAISDELRWPATHIDWDAAAQDLQQDYTAVDFDGVTYWVR